MSENKEIKEPEYVEGTEEGLRWLEENKERLKREIDEYIRLQNGGSHPLKP